MEIITYDFTKSYEPVKRETVPERYFDAGQRLRDEILKAGFNRWGYCQVGKLKIKRDSEIMGYYRLTISCKNGFADTFRFIAHSLAHFVNGHMHESPETCQTNNYVILVDNRSGVIGAGSRGK